MAVPRVKLHPAFKHHLNTKRRKGLALRTVALLSGFSRDSNCHRQLHKPFAPTEQNTARWSIVARLVNYEGETLKVVKS